MNPSVGNLLFPLSLKIVHIIDNERLWPIRSGRSWQKSDRERRANCSRLSVSSKLLSKTSDSLEKIIFFKCFLADFYCFPPFLCPRANQSLGSVTLFKEQRERFTLVALDKRATVSHSLLLIMRKERRERFAHFLEWITLSNTKNKWFAQKTDQRIPNPDESCTPLLT